MGFISSGQRHTTSKLKGIDVLLNKPHSRVWDPGISKFWIPEFWIRGPTKTLNSVSVRLYHLNLRDPDSSPHFVPPFKMSHTPRKGGSRNLE